MFTLEAYMKNAAEVINRQKGEILRLWKEEIRKKLQGAEFTEDMVLLNHIPDLMDDLILVLERAETIEQMTKEGKSNRLFQMSIEHGRHRSASYGYTIDKIIYEYIIFHRVLTDILVAENEYSPEVSNIVKYAVETSMMYASAAFSHSLDEMRQKLVRILAHDLRNPITTVLLGMDIMEQDLDQENFEKIKSLAKSSLKRALDLIEGLLETISIEAGEGMTINFSEIDLYNYINSVHFEASEIYTNKIELDLEGDKEMKGIFDGAMIRRVLENFLSNAIKYGEKNTPVKISVKNSAETINIKVHNRGEPIPEGKKEEIFRFLNTSGINNGGSGKSWGIGLALVKAVIEAHHGQLYVESSKENGTTFGIVLEKFRNKPGVTKSLVNFG